MRAPKCVDVFRQDVKDCRPSGSDLNATFIDFTATLSELFVQVF